MTPAENYEAFDATLLRDPSTYRVRRVGPFEYVMDVEPRPRVITPEVAEGLAAASNGALPLYVEGSQSPLSLKEPYSGSDVDLLVGIDAPDQLPAARAVVEKLTAMQDQIEAPLSPGIVHRPWLALPGLYSAVSLAADSPDRWWWHATPEARFAEARRRITDGLELLADQDAVSVMRDQALGFLPDPVGPERLRECRLVPRWLGLDVLPG